MKKHNPTVLAMLSESCWTFGFTVRQNRFSPALRSFRRGRVAEARAVIRAALSSDPSLRLVVRDLVNRGLHFQA